MAQRDDIVQFLDDYLSVKTIPDVSCNGLQVEGMTEIERVALAVDDCLEAYHKAADANCQMLVVHHGLIWGGLTAITGATYQRIKYLVEHSLNLYAAHLPLDMHPESGNNAVLASMLNLTDREPFGEYKGQLIGVSGTLPSPAPLDKLAFDLGQELGGPTSALPFGPDQIRTVGIVSGGGSDCIPEAITKHLDCVITGESSHENHHLALEGHINVLYCGHYHSEQVGVKALGEKLKAEFGVQTVFLDIPTLV